MPLRRRLAIACAAAVGARDSARGDRRATSSCASSCSARSTASSGRRPGSSTELPLSATFPTPPPSAGGGGADLAGRRRAPVRSCAAMAMSRSRSTTRVQQIAGGNAGAYLEDVKVNGTVLRELTVPVQIGSFGGPVRPGGLPARAPPRRQSDNVLSDLRLVLFLLCAGGIALAACLGRLAARARARAARPRSPRPPSTSARPTTSPAGSSPRRRRGRPARRRASTRCSSGSRAPARRSTNRCARSASSSPTPRTSCARRSRACAPTSRCCSRAASSTDEDRHRLLADVRRAERGAERAGRRPDRARPRRPADHRGRRRPARPRRRRVRSPALAGNSPDVKFESSSAPVVVEGVPERLARARSTTCSTTPPATRPPAGSSRSSSIPTACGSATTAPASTRAGPALRVRPLLPRARTRATARAAASAWRSSARSPTQHGGSVDGRQRARRRRDVHAAAPRHRRRRRRWTPTRRSRSPATRSRSVSRRPLGASRARDPRLPRDQEPLAQEPGADARTRRRRARAAVAGPPASRRSARSRTRRRPRGSPPAAPCGSGSPRSARAR